MPHNITQYPNNLTPSEYHELSSGSAIAPDLIALNFKHLEGDNALEYLLISDKIPRRNGGRVTNAILWCYRHLSSGGWWCSGLDPWNDWQAMEWGRFKPSVPRLDPEKGKPIKYESPPKTPNRVTYFNVSQRIWKRIAKRYGIKRYYSPLALLLQGRYKPMTFWEWVQKHPEIPIILTEGEKKAACLLSMGYVAIALPGIWNGTVKQLKHGLHTLHPDLVPLAQPGRTFRILFDFETRPKTKKAIRQATLRLGKAIEEQGCHCEVVQLPGVEKGIDDWVVALGEKAPGAVAALLGDALSLKDYKQQTWKNLCRGLQRHQPNAVINTARLADVIDLLPNPDILPGLPVSKDQQPLQKEAGAPRPRVAARRKGTRTETGRGQEAEGFKEGASLETASGVSATHLEQAKQTEENFPANRELPYPPLPTSPTPRSLLPAPHSLPSIEDFKLIFPTSGLVALVSDMGTGKTYMLELWRRLFPNSRFLNNGHRVNLLKNLAKRLDTAMYSQIKSGRLQEAEALSITVDSLYKLAGNLERYDCVFIDECCQYLAHLLHSNTCKEHRAEILDVLEYIIHSAKLVIIADAHLDDVTIDFFMAMRPEGEKPFIIQNVHKSGGRPVYWYEGGDYSALVQKIYAAAMEKQKIMVVSSSKRFIKKLERSLLEMSSNQSPVASHQSPVIKSVTSHQSPVIKSVTSHQSPVTSHQSPVRTVKSSQLCNEQSSVIDKNTALVTGRSLPQGVTGDCITDLTGDWAEPPAGSDWRLKTDLTGDWAEPPAGSDWRLKTDLTGDCTECAVGDDWRLATELKVWSVHAENSGTDENVHFIENINTAVKDVDILLASPSLGTGVDISAEHFDVVFGVFQADKLAATECVQMLWRYRLCVPMHIWVAPRPSFGYLECNARKIKERLLQANEMTAFLIRTDRETGKRGAEKDWALDAYCQIEAQRNFSINHLRQDLHSLLEEMGNTIIPVGDAVSSEARDLLKTAGQQLNSEYYQAVANAPDIDRRIYESLQHQDYLNPDDLYKLQKYRIKDSYGLDVCPELVERDEGGKLLSQITSLEAVLAEPGETISDEHGNQAPAPPTIVVERDLADREHHEISMDWANYSVKWLLRHRLGLKPVVEALLDGEWLNESHPLVQQVVSQVSKFNSFLKPLLNLSIPMNQSPMWIVRVLLDQLGCTLTSQRLGSRGNRQRCYGLDLETGLLVHHVLQHRKRKREDRVRRREEIDERNRQHALLMQKRYGLQPVSTPPQKRVNSNLEGGVDTTNNRSKYSLETMAQLLAEAVAYGVEAILGIINPWNRTQRWNVVEALAALYPDCYQQFETLMPNWFNWTEFTGES